MIGDDKFFVVALVLAIIFAGLAVYLIILDIKLSKIEKRVMQKNATATLNQSTETK